MDSGLGMAWSIWELTVTATDPSASPSKTVSRTLTQLRIKGVISPMDSGHILLSKPDDLDDLAEGF